MFDAGSILVLNGLTQSAWVRGEVDIKAEIFCFESLSCLWKNAPSDKKGIKRQLQVTGEEAPLSERGKK